MMFFMEFVLGVNSGFIGSILKEIGNFVNLMSLFLGILFMSGFILEEIMFCMKFVKLDFGGNRFSGLMFMFIGNLKWFIMLNFLSM